MEPISRRTLFAGACAILALGGSGIPAAAQSVVKKLPGGKLSVKLKDLPELANVGGAVKIGSIKGVPVAISRTATNKYVALDLLCPHQQYPVERSEQGWVCKSHGSEFEADGDLVIGPATTALKRVPIKVSRGVATIG
jgi:Rieske Fe-S protein